MQRIVIKLLRVLQILVSDLVNQASVLMFLAYFLRARSSSLHFVCLCVPHINFWICSPIFMELGIPVYIMAIEPILSTQCTHHYVCSRQNYKIQLQGFHQSHCALYCTHCDSVSTLIDAKKIILWCCILPTHTCKPRSYMWRIQSLVYQPRIHF
jgi:hypothetical protein